MAVSPDPSTEELRSEQLRREREEEVKAGEAATPEGERAARRRADRAAYLRDKLDEQARADGED